jgi:lipopolysaccharide/colanic/teichoic acid biosynthesis glycosyltransferase
MLANGAEAVGSCPQSIHDLTPPWDRRKRDFYDRSKRLLDILIVLMVGPAAIIVIALAAVAILVCMGRPVLFFNDRVGQNGRLFRMVKLRTMACGSPSRVVSATAVNDPRVTPLGRILRRSHFDELPQLWNILLGDMTLIGPRPEQPQLVAYYRENIPHYDLRHTVKPGLTGWAQVSFGYAADIEETRRKLTYDLEYVQRYGPKMDLITACKTLQVYLDPRLVR